MPENDNSGVVMILFSMVLFMLFIFTERMELLPIIILMILIGFAI